MTFRPGLYLFRSAPWLLPEAVDLSRELPELLLPSTISIFNGGNPGTIGARKEDAEGDGLLSEGFRRRRLEGGPGLLRYPGIGPLFNPGPTM